MCGPRAGEIDADRRSRLDHGWRDERERRGRLEPGVRCRGFGNGWHANRHGARNEYRFAYAYAYSHADGDAVTYGSAGFGYPYGDDHALTYRDDTSHGLGHDIAVAHDQPVAN